VNIKEKKIDLKKVPEGLVYAVTKEIFREGKILFTIVQKVNLKML